MRKKKFTMDWGSKLKGKKIGFICPEHGYIQGDTCEECKQESDDVSPAVHVFKPRWFEHLDVNPVYVTSKRQLREECKKRNLKSAYLM